MPIITCSSSHPCLLLLLVLLLCCLELGGAAQQACHSQDLSALLAFKRQILSSSSSSIGPSLSFWSADASCCDWDGVTCDDNSASAARVLGLSLPQAGIRATIPASLGNLSSLQACNLSSNLFYGPLPPELASLAHLQVLDLSNNNLSGPLSVLASFRNAQVIIVSNNRFSGALPSFQNFSKLMHFSSNNNSLKGRVPTDACQHAQSLTYLNLSGNSFTGQLEAGLGNCTRLEVLDAGENSLVGPIPSDIYGLTSLTELSLARNNFSGIIDAGIGNLAKLTHLMLGTNNFTGSLPSNLSSCTKLKVLTANSNHFEGPLDHIWFGNMSELEAVDLNTNSFNGTIPASLADCAALQSLNLAKNKLSGVIPSGFNGLVNLSTVFLSSNSLSGSLSSLTDNTQLVSLVLSKNTFNEPLPDSIRGLTNLQVLALGNLNLSGAFPNWLENCTKLQVLDLSWNHLEGPIPSWLGSLTHLFYLDLSNNSFTGIIPPHLMNLPTLAHRDDNTTSLKSVVNNLAIRQKVDSPELQYTQVSAFPPTVYLSHNQFEGPIPAEIGNFRLLLNLDLSFNNLSGSIPDTMEYLMDLESLDLSSNRLSGTIPSSLTHLTFLAYFNVSNNELVGPIPSGNQFLTFSNKSYLGNPGLCGPPLPPCGGSSGPQALASVYKQSSSHSRIAILVPICLVIALVALFVAWISWKLSRRSVVYQGNVSFKDMEGPQCLTEALSFSVELFYKHGKLTVFDLFKATNNFDSANIVGCGGFGLVYRADLADGSRLAIKKLTGDCGQMEREFRAEVETLSKAQHKNLVPLQGYLQVGNDRLLLYSYMENGSLDYWLHERSDGGTCLDWPMRLKIARGAAHGLAYLHQSCDPHIVHRDIKSSNILLDEKFEAHLADFGLARLMMSTDTHVTTEVVGTLGYIPPEYGHALNATPRGDVYSFGVVLLELLTRRRPVDVCKGRGAGDLVAWVLQRRTSGKPEEIFDVVLRSKGHEEQMLQVLDVACPCINPDPLKRPTITDIVHWLDQIGQDHLSTKALF